MKIGIDLTGLGARREGIVSYTGNVTKAMLKRRRAHKYYLYARRELPELNGESATSTFVRKTGGKNRKLVQQFILPIKAKTDKLDVLFFPFNSAALWCPVRSVVTIHDLQPFILPKQYADVHGSTAYGSRMKSLINSTYWRTILRSASRKAARVIAVSEATKRDIVDIFGVSDDRVDVVYEGVDHDRFNRNSDGIDTMEFRNRYGLPGAYILCVGVNPYKNLEGSLDAYRMVRPKIPEGVKLVLAGNNYLGKRLEEMIASRGLVGDVILTGYFPEEDLKYLYQCADLFLFPSFYEGFGLPVLESFACGTPVVTSRTEGSMEEIAGGAAMLADPMDAASIANGIARIYSDGELRARLIDAGLARAREFSWERAAEGTLDVLERACA